MKKIKIGKYLINNKRTFITFEAGATHNGFKSAKKLIDIASIAGADAIKFQLFDKKNLLSDKKQIINFKYLNHNNKILEKKESLYKIFERRQLNENEWIKLKNYADKKKILFFLTVGGFEELKIAKKLNCQSIKIASADINFFPLIRKVAKLKKNIQIDTGNASLEEIKKTIKLIEKYGNKNIIIHYCPPGYPAKYDEVSIKNILTLKDSFNYPIAYSDHSPNYDLDVMAITLGANLVEKTITLNKYKKEIEHMFSLEKNEAKKFVEVIRNIEKTLIYKNNLKKKINKKRLLFRRSVFLNQDVKKKDKLSEVKVKFLRPGIGISPEKYEKLINKKFKKNLKKNLMLKESHLSE